MCLETNKRERLHFDGDIRTCYDGVEHRWRTACRMRGSNAGDEFTPIGEAASDGIHYVEKIAEGTWRIDERCLVNCYLLTGTERALLIDTGLGFGDVRAVVRGLSDLPLDVVLTHRHCDHAGGVAWFGSYYVHRNDLRPIYAITASRLACKVLLRMWMRMLAKMRRQGMDLPVDIGADTLTFTAPARGGRLMAMDESHVFHLGGRDISLVNVPGHTRGSIVLLDSREKLMFTGDDANPAIWMHLPGCTSLATWAPGCETILELADEYVPYAGHGRGLLERGQIAGVLERGRELIATRGNTILHHTDVYPSIDEVPNLTYDTARIH